MILYEQILMKLNRNSEIRNELLMDRVCGINCQKAKNTLDRGNIVILSNEEFGHRYKCTKLNEFNLRYTIVCAYYFN